MSLISNEAWGGEVNSRYVYSGPITLPTCLSELKKKGQVSGLLYTSQREGIHYRKSCASSGACLIASSGYQQFCTGELNSVCITCCDTPLCNGPKLKKRPVLSAAPPSPPNARPLHSPLLLLPFLLLLFLLSPHPAAPLSCT
ncbi:hypothetical protein ACEWY4_002154 [Coilia grayii]|uniref:Ly6/PLAUR domain-containing protein 1 n=1 Tax=Coilia grayii TaxID=363190 RepID=A0ABD1KUZ8_9TELE